MTNMNVHHVMRFTMKASVTPSSITTIWITMTQDLACALRTMINSKEILYFFNIGYFNSQGGGGDLTFVVLSLLDVWQSIS